MGATTLKIVLYRSHKLRNGYHPLKLRITHERKPAYINIGQYCHPHHWNDQAQWISTAHPSFEELDHFLRTYHKRASDALLKLRSSSINYCLEDVVKALSPHRSGENLSVYFKNVIATLETSGRHGTARWHQETLAYLERCNGDKPLTWNRISVPWLKKLELDYLGKGNSPNGLSVHLRSLRSIINQAVQDGTFQGESPFAHYKIKHTRPRKRSLGLEALHKIHKLDLKESPALHQTRQLFMLMFYLQGINFIDLAYLKSEDIKDGRLEYRRRKVHHPLSILLTEEAMEIIAELSPQSHPPFLLPVLNPNSTSPMPNQLNYRRKKFNQRLRKLAEKAAIANFTAYSARHAWASLANEGQIPLTVISQALGHASVRTTQIYLDEISHAATDKATRSMSELFKKKSPDQGK